MGEKHNLSERDIVTKFIIPASDESGWNKQTQLREEVSEQIKALNNIKQLAESYGYPEIATPALTCQQAVQHIYFAYLAGAKENNGAATSLGRVSTFIDIYAEKDLQQLADNALSKRYQRQLY